jgi:L-fuconolactonase
MMIVDAQVHAYERNHPGRPWASVLPGPEEVSGDDMVAAMDEIGVDGALLTSVWTMYRFDPSYAIEVRQKYPDRFALVAPVDANRDDVGDVIASWAEVPGSVAVRIMHDVPLDPDNPSLRRVVVAAAAHNLPLCMVCRGNLPQVADVATAFPDTQLVVDHLGMIRMSPDEDAWGDLPALLALGRFPNVAVKVTASATLSNEPFPFNDLWGPLGQVFEAFGFDRCMWGTDWTRTTIPYGDALAAVRDTDRLSEAERTALLGGTVERIFGWAPGAAPNA